MSRERPWNAAWVHRFYSGRPGWKNGTVEFHELIASVTPTGARILEVGAGPQNETSRFLSGLGELHGVDPDAEVLRNQDLVRSQVMQDERIPYESEHFDLCVSNYVVEHVADPVAHLREIHRVLKPGGAYVLRTPSRWHYVGLVASLTPHWFHELVANRLRNLPPEAHKPYPTRYAMNSLCALRRKAKAAGFIPEVLRGIEKNPSYGMSSRVLFLAMMAWERIVNSCGVFAPIRANILAVLRKRSEAPGGG